MLAEYAAVFRHAASQAWGWQELSAHLAALGVTADADTAAWAKVWKAEQATAHEFLVQRSIWNNTLEGVNWRVDLLSAGAQQQQQHGADEAGMMEPVALMQLKVRALFTWRQQHTLSICLVSNHPTYSHSNVILLCIFAAIVVFVLVFIRRTTSLAQRRRCSSRWIRPRLRSCWARCSRSRRSSSTALKLVGWEHRVQQQIRETFSVYMISCFVAKTIT